MNGCSTIRWVLLPLICSFLRLSACYEGPTMHVTTDLHSSVMKVTENLQHTLTMNYTVSDQTSRNNTLFMTFCSKTDDSDIAETRITGTDKIVEVSHKTMGNISVTVTGLFVGRTVASVYLGFFHRPTPDVDLCSVKKLHRVQHVQNFNITDLYSASLSVYELQYTVVVIREKRAVDVAFNVIVILLVLVVNLGMGCKTKLPVVKETLRRPVGPVTGVCSQFIIMPLVSFAAAYIFSFDPALAIGFFALGCSPGGSASNAYTLFLGGDVSLSITMTFISTLASLGMIPLWLFTLGRQLNSDASIKVPFQNIIFSLLGLIIPVCIGMLVQHKRPASAKVLVKVSKAVMVLFLLFVLTVGVYANIYIFRLMKVKVLLTAALLPYLGFLLGGLVAFTFRMSKAHIITIAVETGIQNTGIAIVLLLLSLEPPESDISIVAPIASALFTPIPIWLAIAARYMYRHWYSKEKPLPMDDVDNKEPDVEDFDDD